MRTIKFWEEKGLIAPHRRTEGGFRLYRPGEVVLLAFIKDLQAFNYTLAEIGTILETGRARPGGDRRGPRRACPAGDRKDRGCAGVPRGADAGGPRRLLPRGNGVRAPPARRQPPSAGESGSSADREPLEAAGRQSRKVGAARRQPPSRTPSRGLKPRLDARSGFMVCLRGYSSSILKDYHMTDIFGFLPLMMGVPEGIGRGAAGGGGTQLVTMLVTFGLIIVVFYFLVIRPQNKKKKDAKKMLQNIKKGDRVVTIGGMHGSVESVRDDAVVLKVDDNVKIKFSKSAIATVVSSAAMIRETPRSRTFHEKAVPIPHHSRGHRGRLLFRLALDQVVFPDSAGGQGHGGELAQPDQGLRAGAGR